MTVTTYYKYILRKSHHTITEKIMIGSNLQVLRLHDNASAYAFKPARVTIEGQNMTLHFELSYSSDIASKLFGTERGEVGCFDILYNVDTRY